MRANTNLRVALRMADADDSNDVAGTPIAGTFDPSVPGRGLAKTGPGRLSLFQTGYVGGITTGERRIAPVDVCDLTFGSSDPWDDPWDDDFEAKPDETPFPSDGTDIGRVVATLRQASDQAGLEKPRRPWLPELADLYDLAALPTRRLDSELVFGVIDKPDAEEQGVVAFRTDVEGSMAVFGAGGSGKSTLLRSLAVSAGLTSRGGPCHVYALDFATRGLAMLDALPHVGSVISADDVERTARLFRKLRKTIDERAASLAAINAGTLDEYRNLAGQPDEPRILLLLDGYPAFRAAFEAGSHGWLNDALLSVAAGGSTTRSTRGCPADRPGAVPSALNERDSGPGRSPLGPRRTTLRVPQTSLVVDLVMRPHPEEDLWTRRRSTSLFWGERLTPSAGRAHWSVLLNQ